MPLNGRDFSIMTINTWKNLTPKSAETETVWQHLHWPDERGHLEQCSAPVEHLYGRYFVSQLRTPREESLWTVFFRLDEQDSPSGSAILHYAIYNKKSWLLSNIYQSPESDSSPKKLSRFTGIAINDLYPLSYNIRGLVSKGVPAALCSGQIKPTALNPPDDIADVAVNRQKRLLRRLGYEF